MESVKGIIKTKEIDQVTLKYLKIADAEGPIYSDGPVEKKLYKKFKYHSDNNYYDNDNVKFTSWAYEYHLSPVRQNLLKWYPFKPNGCVLEIGAGCGAHTGLLSNALKKVTVLEYSARRALITAQRHSKHSNIEIYVGGLQDFRCEQKFDYITVIGVLEYAGTYYGGSNPYVSFLSKLREMLNQNGELILAIENKIGLKYLCGAPEDHTGRVFDSLYDYPYYSKVRTFSKKEITEIINKSGFTNLQWYYPFPDYKLPQQVLSDEVIPGETDTVWNLFPASGNGRLRKEVICEKRLGKTFTHSGLFGEFANSFLIVARSDHIKEKTKCLRFYGANLKRKSEYQTNVQFHQTNDEIIVIKEADNTKAKDFIETISKRETLAKSVFAQKAEIITGHLNGSRLYYPYIDYPSLEDLIAKEIKNRDSGFGKHLIQKYSGFISSLSIKTCSPNDFLRKFNIKLNKNIKTASCIPTAVLDCIPRNIKIHNNNWYIIDNEWTYDFPLPIDYLIFRAILTLINDLQSIIQNTASKDMPVVLFRGYGKNKQYIPYAWLEIFHQMEIHLEDMAHWEMQFQNHILSKRKSLLLSLKNEIRTLFLGKIRLKKKPKVLTKIPLYDLKADSEIIYQIRLLLQKIKKRLYRALHTK